MGDGSEAYARLTCTQAIHCLIKIRRGNDTALENMIPPKEETRKEEGIRPVDGTCRLGALVICGDAGEDDTNGSVQGRKVC